MRMKKFLALVSALCMVCAVVPVAEHSVSDTAVLSAYAVDEITDGMLNYTKYNDHVEVSKCNKNAMIVEIPAKVDGLPVTKIGDYAFSGCSSLTSDITIPNSVKSIGTYAFSGCSGVKSITVPDSVTSIGTYAFQECSGLTSFTFPKNIKTISSYMFYVCTSLTSVTIPDNITSIGTYAFSSCSSLKSVTIPSNVTDIDDKAFSDCSGLASVTISNGVTSIGGGAFSGCTALTSVTLPNSVTNIGVSAFSSCSKLASVTISNPDCVIYSNYNTLGGKNSTHNNNITIYGENPSTAQEYARTYGYSFIALEKSTEPETEPEIQPITEPETNNDIQYMEENKITLDFNKDGFINAKDASLILVYAAEKGAGNVKSLEEFLQKNGIN